MSCGAIIVPLRNETSTLLCCAAQTVRKLRSPFRYVTLARRACLCLCFPGWVSYCAIESFGSICVALFWAFVNSSVNVETAKSAFGLIIAGGNLGSIIGPTMAVTKVNGRQIVLGVVGLLLGRLALVGFVNTRYINLTVSARFQNMAPSFTPIFEARAIFVLRVLVRWLLLANPNPPHYSVSIYSSDGTAIRRLFVSRDDVT